MVKEVIPSCRTLEKRYSIFCFKQYDLVIISLNIPKSSPFNNKHLIIFFLCLKDNKGLAYFTLRIIQYVFDQTNHKTEKRLGIF